MLKFKGGDNVKAGLYWNVREWEARIVPREGGVLAGGAEEAYLRLPLIAILALAPLMGALFAFFLPFIGIAMVAMYLAGLLRRLFTTTPPAAEQVAGPARAAAGSGERAKDERVRKAA